MLFVTDSTGSRATTLIFCHTIHSSRVTGGHCHPAPSPGARGGQCGEGEGSLWEGEAPETLHHTLYCTTLYFVVLLRLSGTMAPVMFFFLGGGLPSPVAQLLTL